MYRMGLLASPRLLPGRLWQKTMAGLSSNGNTLGIRDLHHQPTFELSAQAIGLDVETLDDRLWGVTFTIARIPELFPVMASNVMGEELCAARYTGNPPLIVWFTYDETTVQLWFVTRADTDAE